MNSEYLNESGRESIASPAVESKSLYIPKRVDLLKEYDINIRFLSRGVIIRVGCKEIAFEDIDKAMVALEEYVKNPYETVTAWQKVFDEK